MEDREYILPRVRAAGGFDGVNKQVKAALRGWLAATGRALLREAEATEGAAEVARLQFGLGDLLRLQGEYGEAEVMYLRPAGREQLEQCKDKAAVDCDTCFPPYPSSWSRTACQTQSRALAGFARASWRSQ